MKRTVLTATRRSLVIIAALTLAGCAANGQLTPAVSADLQNALNVACPIYARLAASPPKMNSTQSAAFAAVAAVCPPNPAPVTQAAAVSDILAAAAIIAGL